MNILTPFMITNPKPLRVIQLEEKLIQMDLGVVLKNLKSSDVDLEINSSYSKMSFKGWKISNLGKNSIVLSKDTFDNLSFKIENWEEDGKGFILYPEKSSGLSIKIRKSAI